MINLSFLDGIFFPAKLCAAQTDDMSYFHTLRSGLSCSKGKEKNVPFNVNVLWSTVLSSAI